MRYIKDSINFIDNSDNFTRKYFGHSGTSGSNIHRYKVVGEDKTSVIPVTNGKYIAVICVQTSSSDNLTTYWGTHLGSFGVTKIPPEITSSNWGECYVKIFKINEDKTFTHVQDIFSPDDGQKNITFGVGLSMAGDYLSISAGNIDTRRERLKDADWEKLHSGGGQYSPGQARVQSPNCWTGFYIYKYDESETDTSNKWKLDQSPSLHDPSKLQMPISDYNTCYLQPVLYVDSGFKSLYRVYVDGVEESRFASLDGPQMGRVFYEDDNSHYSSQWENYKDLRKPSSTSTLNLGSPSGTDVTNDYKKHNYQSEIASLYYTYRTQSSDSGYHVNGQWEGRKSYSNLPAQYEIKSKLFVINKGTDKEKPVFINYTAQHGQQYNENAILQIWTKEPVRWECHCVIYLRSNIKDEDYIMASNILNLENNYLFVYCNDYGTGARSGFSGKQNLTILHIPDSILYPDVAFTGDSPIKTYNISCPNDGSGNSAKFISPHPLPLTSTISTTDVTKIYETYFPEHSDGTKSLSSNNAVLCNIDVDVSTTFGTLVLAQFCAQLEMRESGAAATNQGVAYRYDTNGNHNHANYPYTGFNGTYETTGERFFNSSDANIAIKKEKTKAVLYKFEHSTTATLNEISSIPLTHWCYPGTSNHTIARDLVLLANRNATNRQYISNVQIETGNDTSVINDVNSRYTSVRNRFNQYSDILKQNDIWPYRVERPYINLVVDGQIGQYPNQWEATFKDQGGSISSSFPPLQQGLEYGRYYKSKMYTDGNEILVILFNGKDGSCVIVKGNKNTDDSYSWTTSALWLDEHNRRQYNSHYQHAINNVIFNKDVLLLGRIDSFSVLHGYTTPLVIRDMESAFGVSESDLNTMSLTIVNDTVPLTLSNDIKPTGTNKQKRDKRKALINFLKHKNTGKNKFKLKRQEFNLDFNTSSNYTDILQPENLNVISIENNQTIKISELAEDNTCWYTMIDLDQKATVESSFGYPFTIERKADPANPDDRDHDRYNIGSSGNIKIEKSDGDDGSGNGTLLNGTYTNRTNLGYLKEGQTATINNEVFSFSSVAGIPADQSGSGADPYVFTLSGQLYKLDNTNANCRMISGTLNGKQITINVEMTLDSDIQSRIMNEKCQQSRLFKDSKEVQTHYIENQSFFTKVYINYNGSELLYDIIAQKIIKQTGTEIETSIKSGNVDTVLPMYKKDIVNNYMEVSIENVGIRLIKYNNPQIRTSVDVYSAKNIENADGFLVRPMNTEMCGLSSIENTQALSNVPPKAFRQNITEVFETRDGKNIQKEKYSIDSF